MAGPERMRGIGFPPSLLGMVLLVAALLFAGCGTSAATPAAPASQTMSRVEPPSRETDVPVSEPTVPTESSETPASATPKEADVDDSVIIIERPEEYTGQANLVEAARAERQRRRDMGEPVYVITDKNLTEYAVGEVTSAEPKQGSGDVPADRESADGGDEAEQPVSGRAEEERREDYWRRRAREIRIGWRDAVQQVEELEGRVAELRQRFYAEDDGYYRDSQIKPAWDRAIDLLEQVKRDVVSRQEELGDLMEEGRRAGALPGWLREGIEFEPLLEPEEEPIHDPSEPVIFDEGDGEPV